MKNATATTTATTDKPLTKKEAGRAGAGRSLKTWLKPGDTVYTILRHVSASGLSRCIDVIIISNNKPFRLTWSAAIALDATHDRKRDALRVTGVGEDCGFSTVYHLSHMLFGNGHALRHRWL